MSNERFKIEADDDALTHYLDALLLVPPPDSDRVEQAVAASDDPPQSDDKGTEEKAVETDITGLGEDPHTGGADEPYVDGGQFDAAVEPDDLDAAGASPSADVANDDGPGFDDGDDNVNDTTTTEDAFGMPKDDAPVVDHHETKRVSVETNGASNEAAAQAPTAPDLSEPEPDSDVTDNNDSNIVHNVPEKAVADGDELAGEERDNASVNPAGPAEIENDVDELEQGRIPPAELASSEAQMRSEPSPELTGKAVQASDESGSDGEVDKPNTTQDNASATLPYGDMATSPSEPAPESVDSASTDWDDDAANKVAAHSPQPIDSVVAQPVGNAAVIECRIISVAGVTLAVRHTEVSAVKPWPIGYTVLEQLGGQVGGEWAHEGLQVLLVDTARIILPTENHPMLAPLSSRAHEILILASGQWALVSENASEVVAVATECIHWRGESGRRPWLAGMVSEPRCALLDATGLIAQLEQQREMELAE